MDAGPVLRERENRQESSSPPVPIKTYQWEEVRRAREKGGYPWTYLDKPALDDDEITAETILRDSEPRRTMSRNNSRDRSGRSTPHSNQEDQPQKILMLDSSPGSSRKLGEGEDEESVNIPHFSKEISLDSEEDLLDKRVPIEMILPDNLVVKEAKVISVSPKSILKRKHAEQPPPAPNEESPRNSKCCHPLVEKIKHIADKTIHKVEKSTKRDPSPKNKLGTQEILTLDNSPGTERRERQKAAKLEKTLESDETVKISLVMSNDDIKTEPSAEKAKEHEYELMSVEPLPQKKLDGDEKSGGSQDPSLVLDEPMEDEDEATETINRIKSMYDTSMTVPRKDEITCVAIVSEVDDSPKEKKKLTKDDGKISPGVTITEVTDDEQAPEEADGDDEVDKKVHFESDETNEPDPAKGTSEDRKDAFCLEIGWTSEGGAPRTKPLRPSREGSFSGVTTPEVRCACQFFQSDSLLPDKPTFRSVAQARSEHEYEPIGKPVAEDAVAAPVAAAAVETPPPTLLVSDHEFETHREDDASSTTSHERQFLRPPTEEEHMNVDDYEPESDAGSPSIALQKEIEDRYFIDTPTTPESRTDCEISTSQVDSSALENLPLKKENRKRSALGAEGPSLKQRISAQTGRLKTKLKTIKKPQFSMPERPKFERPKFNLPERPKFNIDRSKIKLPDRPKFERPKINLPDRSKFKMPERPKFNLPERPKFFEKTRFSLPDRPKFSMPDRSKFKLPDRPKMNFSGFGKSKEKATDSKSESTSETKEPKVEGAPSAKRRILDFDFRTYPRFSKFRKDKKTSKAERPGTPPPIFSTVPRTTKDRQAVMSTSHWEDSSNRSADDEPRHYGLPKGYPSQSDRDFESKLAQVDKDYNLMQKEYEQEIARKEKAKIDNAEIWNVIEQNSVQRLEHRASLPCYMEDEQNDEQLQDEDNESSAASTGHHRRGVLEEIDNDEFFLRQKGISQDNIEVGKYLSDEIRDAFRSPINALSQMDNNLEKPIARAYIDIAGAENNNNLRIPSDDMFIVDQNDLDDDLDQNEQDMMEHDDGYYTFPPIRPSRSRKLKSQEIMNQKQDTSDKVTASPDVIEVNNITAPATFHEIQTKQENEKNDVIRKSIFSPSFKDNEVLENLNEYENEMDQIKYTPVIPKRRKKAPKSFEYPEDTETFNESYDPEKWAAMKNGKIPDNEIIVHRMEYVMPTAGTEVPESPIPPKRDRSRSHGSRTLSACDDDRTSRGAESLTLDSHTHLPVTDADFLDDIEDYPGYAIVDKPVAPKKMEPPPRPPAPVRRHRSTKSLSGDRQFFTVPRALKEGSPPKRPSRNYSTLGPSRPPRKKSSASLSDLPPVKKTRVNRSITDVDSTQYVEIDDDGSEMHKALQSGDVVQKMKDRPLPPPPRPPRGPRRKKDSDDRKDDANGVASLEFEGEINIADMDDFDYQPDITDILAENDALIDKKPSFDEYDQEEIVEIEVSTQTDPLPDDFDYTIGMEEPFTDSQKDTMIEYLDEPEENSIDAEILHKGLQRFRESSRPESRTSRPRTPADKIKTPVDRMSPTAILLERRVDSPTRIDDYRALITEASLTVVPIDEPAPAQPRPPTPSQQRPPTPSQQRPPTPSQTRPVAQSQPLHSQIWEALNKRDQIDSILDEAQPTFKETVKETPVLRETRPIMQEHVPNTEASIPSQQNVLPESVQDIRVPQPTVPLNMRAGVEVLRTQKLQVSDLEVERLNVSELSASKILVSEIEGLSLQVTDINSKSGNIVVRGIELAPGIFDDLLQKFAQMNPPSAAASTQTNESTEPRPESTSQEIPITQNNAEPLQSRTETLPDRTECSPPLENQEMLFDNMESMPSTSDAPERPPLPHMPTMYPMGYFPEYSIPPGAFFRMRPGSERPQNFSDDNRRDDEPVKGPTRRRKPRREPEPASSSEDDFRSSRRHHMRSGEPSVADLSSQLFSACQTSMGRTLRYILSYITSHFNSGESKKDMQMALVIVLVMVAGLILLGIGDGKTVHHHHWDFYNPPNDQ